MSGALAWVRGGLIFALAATLHLLAALAILPAPLAPVMRIDLSRIDLRVVTRLPGPGSGLAPGPMGGGLKAAGTAALDAARDLLVDFTATAAAAFEVPPAPPAKPEPVDSKKASAPSAKKHVQGAPPLRNPAKGRRPLDPGYHANRDSQGGQPLSGVRGGAPGGGSAGGGGLGPDLGGPRLGGSDLGSLARAVTAAIRRRLDYPESARRDGAAGRVTVTFTLDPSGRIGGAALAGSSGNPELDRAVLAALRAASPVRLPIRLRTPLELTLPVAFELAGRR